MKYKIVFQWRHPNGPIGDPSDWRSWRVFASWPIAFASYEDAEKRILTGDIFYGLRHHDKVSCAIVPIDWKPRPKQRGNTRGRRLRRL